MKNTTTTDKRHYRRLLAVLQKNNGRTFADIAKEHGVSIRSVQRWVSAYIHPDGNKRIRDKENR